MEGNPWYKRPYRIHRNVGGGDATVICPTSIGKRCPICDYRVKRGKEGAPKEETDALKSSLRNLYLVIPLDSKKHPAELHVLDISQYNFQNLLNIELKERPEFGIFPDPEEGLTLKVRFDSKTIADSKPFPVASRIDFLERDEQYGEEIIDNSPNVDEMIHILPFAEIEAILFETEPDKEEDGGKLTPIRKKEERDEDREEKPARRTMERTSEKAPERPARRAPVEEQQPEKPARTITRSAPERTTASSKERCPYGHKFGIDTEKFKECNDCEIYDDCLDEKDSK
jgi:hypothetical protein